jgi:hypothetical protein
VKCHPQNWTVLSTDQDIAKKGVNRTAKTSDGPQGNGKVFEIDEMINCRARKQDVVEGQYPEFSALTLSAGPLFWYSTLLPGVMITGSQQSSRVVGVVAMWQVMSQAFQAQSGSLREAQVLLRAQDVWLCSGLELRLRVEGNGVECCTT